MGFLSVGCGIGFREAVHITPADGRAFGVEILEREIKKNRLRDPGPAAGTNQPESVLSDYLIEKRRPAARQATPARR